MGRKDSREQPPSTQHAREVWSFFTGAMGLDLGLEAVGLTPTLAVELDPVCCSTIRANRPSLKLLETSVQGLTGAKLRRIRRPGPDGVYLMAGGPPCQSFSSGGRRAALSDPRGNLIYEYLRLVGEVRPRYFILENVANIVTAAVRHRPIALRPGQHWSLKRYSADGTSAGGFTLDADELSGTAIQQLLDDIEVRLGYDFAFGILDAAEHGSPQHRLRFVLYGSREGPPPPLPASTHGPGLLPFRTVRDALSGLEGPPGPHSEYTPEVRRLFQLVPPGGNWRALPEGLKREALGGAWEAGGGKTGFFRRLSWDAPSPTVTGRANRKASGLCHPTADRPLSVRECAALQGFPASWLFTGAMNRQYLQIGNAVPVELGRAAAQPFACPAAARPASSPDRNAMLKAALHKLRSAARNKKVRAEQLSLAEALAG